MTTFNVDSLDFVDDEEARFGADADFATRFDSANSRLELEDLTNATVGYVPQGVGTDLVGGKYAQTVAEGKALADDGNVYDSIQTAVDNASSYVRVGPGEFRESVTIDTAGLTLQGSGERTVIESRDFGIKSNPDEVTISSMTVNAKTPQGTAVEVFGTHTFVENVTVERAGGTGIFTEGSNIVITNCTVNSTDDRGITINARQNIVVNCNVDNAALFGIFIDADETIVNTNRVENCSDTGINVRGVSENTVVTGNNIRNCNTGIAVNGDKSIISNNRISRSNDDISAFTSGSIIDSNLTT